MAEGVKYIKISKKDKNGVDKTNVLQTLTELTIPYSTGNVRYDILDIVEKPTFFLYRVENPNVEWADRAEIEYDFTGSILNQSPTYNSNQDMTGAPDLFIKIPITSSITDNLNFLNLGSQINYSNISLLNTYQLLTYPQETLLIEFSGSIMFEPSVTGTGTAGVGLVYINENDVEPNFDWRTTQGNSAATFQTTPNTTNPVTASFHISASISSSVFLPGDSFYPTLETYIFGGAQISASFTQDTYFSITSTTPTGPTFNTIPEPYFSSDFNRALDSQPLLNNAVDARLSDIYQDVDYNSGVITPTNFDLLISGSALKATVQDSNYTLLRHINPRYNGSRSTSQKLNEWTKGDVGTYGKVPTVESLKTYIAYCDWIGGTTPELTNASGAHIKYLIDDDGNAVDPNTSEISQYISQGTFIPGETTRIKWDLPGSEATRTIIRGGQNVRPILYNQIGHPSSSPAMTFTSSINFEDLSDNGLTGLADYQATLNKDANQTITGGSWTKVDYPKLFSSGSGVISGYVGDGLDTYRVTYNLVNEGISLNFKTTLTFTNPTLQAIGGNAIRLYNTTQAEQVGETVYLNGDGFVNGTLSGGKAELNINIPNIGLTAGDIYEIQAFTNLSSLTILSINSNLSITQIPSPGATSVTTSGLINPIPAVSQSAYRGVYITDPTFLSYYGSPRTKQTDITTSGFNSIRDNVEFQPGDEIRFEGDEGKVFMIEKIEIDRFDFSGANIPTIFIQLDKELSTTSTAIETDEFAIRRYVDEPSIILFNGFKPANSTGPYIFTPEYISPKLNDNIDKYLEDLSQKGLI